MRPGAYRALLILAFGSPLAMACERHPAAPPAGPQPAAWFSDRAQEAGLAFTHVNGMSGKLYMSEILAPGVALFDMDNDGDLDVYVPQGYTLGGPSTTSRGRLYRNDLPSTRPDDGPGPRSGQGLHFTDVTDHSGIVTTGYGMGVATGDFDNDGFVDLYLTNFGSSQLFHNNGDGTFTDVTKSSGTGVTGWTVPATFFDYDRDGWLDLYVGSYLQYSTEASTKCFSPSGALDYCTPNTYKPLPGRLF